MPFLGPIPILSESVLTKDDDGLIISGPKWGQNKEDPLNDFLTTKCLNEKKTFLQRIPKDKLNKRENHILLPIFFCHDLGLKYMLLIF